MQIGFFIKVLPWESRIIFEGLAVVVGVFKWHVSAKRMHVVPTPDRGVAFINNHSWRVEMIRVHIVNLYRRLVAVGFLITAMGISSSHTVSCSTNQSLVGVLVETLSLYSPINWLFSS